MGVALGDADVGVAEDLLDDADVHVLLNEQRAGRVTAVVYTSVTDAGFPEDRLPFLPVLPRVDRPAVRLSEEDVLVFPG